MWTLIIFLLLRGLHCTVVTAPPSPFNVRFSSVNLRNVLQWQPGKGTSDDTLFTVEYAIYGESIAGNRGRRVHWRPVQKCTRVVRTWCDLSRETEDEEQGYYAKVRAVSWRASSKWAVTQRRFDPKLDTTFGPPLVSVEIDNNSIIITLKGPMRYLSKNHSSVLSMAALYPQMTYNLSINNIDRNLMHHVPVVASPYKYRLTDYNTEYCFSAQSRFLSMPIECQSSDWHCITTPQDPAIEQLRRVVLCIVIPALCCGVIVVVGYVLYQYLTGQGQKQPYTLNPPSFHPPPFIFALENPKQILVSIIQNEPPSDPVSITSDPVCSKQQRCSDSGPPSSCPQRPGALPEELPYDSSVEYGFVSTAPIISVGGEGEESERRLFGETDGAGEHQTCMDGDSYRRKETGAMNVASTCISAQEMFYRSQNSLQASLLPHTPMHSQPERSHLSQAYAWSHMNPVLLAQKQLPSQSFQDSSTGEVSRKEEERPGLFPHRNPQTGLFKVFGNEMNEKLRVKAEELDGDADEGNNQESVPLFSAYATQNTKNTLTFTDYLPNQYAVLTSRNTEKSEEEHYHYYEEEAGSVWVDWDPEMRKIVLPEVQMKYSEGERLAGRRESGEGGEGRIGAEGEESYVTKGRLRLENVFVRQGSEEEAEGWREAEERSGRWRMF